MIDACTSESGWKPPAGADSNDPAALRAALIQESIERRFAECRADMQKELAEESESHTCGVWLVDESETQCELWMVYVKDDRLHMPQKEGWGAADAPSKRPACESLAAHLFNYRPGWTQTIEYGCDDVRLPEAFREFAKRMASATVVATPLQLGTRTLGWMTISSPGVPQAEHQWWRVALMESMARHAALALHNNRLNETSRREEHPGDSRPRSI